MSDEHTKKAELLRILTDVDPEAAKLEAMGQEMIQAARLSRDVAAPMRQILMNLPSGSFESGQLDRELASWQAWQGMASQVQTSQTMVNTFVAAASGAINTTVSGVIFAVPLGQHSPPPVEAARTTLFQVLSRNNLVDQVHTSMTRLGLDTRGSTARSALELLKEAHGALERPVVEEGGPTSVLISVRESIDAAITQLIRRRPVQEKVSGWRGKVLSLGQHCACTSLPAGHFDRLGT